jgi:hypothetical protein
VENDCWPLVSRDVPKPCQYPLAFDFLGMSIAAGRPIKEYGPPAYGDPTVMLVKARPDATCSFTLVDGNVPLALLFEVGAGTETHGQLVWKFPGYHALRTFGRSWQDLADEVSVAARVLCVFTREGRMCKALELFAADPTRL